MANRLSNNPFVALFGSVEAAERYISLRESGLLRLLEYRPRAERKVVANENRGVSNDRRLQVETERPVFNEENSPRDMTKGIETCITDCSSRITEELKKTGIARLTEEIFGFTVNKVVDEGKNLIFLEDLASEIAPKNWIDMEVLEQALFQRLLLEEPSTYLLNKTVNRLERSDNHVTEKEVISYLFECYKRLCSPLIPKDVKEEEIEEVKNLILRNAATALRQPALFEAQELHLQIINLFRDTSAPPEDFINFFTGISEQFVRDESEPINVLLEAFAPTLDFIQNDVAQSNIITFNRCYLHILQTFSVSPELGAVLLLHSTPKETSHGRLYADTLIGSILSLSCLPKTPNGPYEFFQDPLQSPDIEGANIWPALSFICENMHKIFYNLLKSSTQLKHETLSWLANCLHSNSARGKLWTAHNLGLGAPACVSDGFMLNLGCVLLHLCQPICSNLNDLKVNRIDPTYCAVKVKDDAEAHYRGVHMKGLDSETCLIPIAEDEQRPTAEKYSFVTECFFMAHRALDLGFRVALERLMQLYREVTQIQRVFVEVQEQGSFQSEVVQTIRQRLEREMTRCFSIRAALLEPHSLSLMVQFHVATAVWLVQVATDATNETERISFVPAKLREITFPLPEQVPSTLSCVPEFLIENTVGFLSFLRRFNPRTLEEQGFDFLSPILTEVLVFMGSQQRMRNPHLRARLAECLESLLPHHKENPAFSTSSYGGFFRERLFKEHPHRNQIVRSLLEVFVGIEMTGQSVAFEQKFNYRRPMYVVMDYLWQIEEHKDCFRQLAAEAESNMEAVSPPIFLRFINLLMNDAVFLLDEALSNMAQLRQMQAARDSGEWRQLPTHEQEQNEALFQNTGMIARFFWVSFIILTRNLRFHVQTGVRMTSDD
ncbi:ubiquitin conjugation factor E4 A isoform X2 [Schistocerca cancellata]|uniref:ubiquitin conjugation factor E4 A isoform X2 n=1 Tax=Schistocerca cancellata TaxID=274614 RepID=UPI0021183DED|nr:ubiquitin conjugation factor E4 A isoform X2 [Schistocerca cancellata]